MFKKEIIIQTSLSKSQIICELKSICEDWHKDNSLKKFEGKINDDGTFSISLCNESNSSNNLRPKIIGKIIENETNNTVLLYFNLPNNAVLGMISALTFSIIGMIISFTLSLEIKWYVIGLFSLLFYCFVYLFYTSKVNDSIKILKAILR